jgi:probable phosphoglycerate mutase
LLIYLIRHGEKASKKENVMDIELTPKGFRQAELLGRRLVGSGIERIYASDMARAVQTAVTVNRFLNVPLEIRSFLREIDMGECETLGWEQAYERYPEFKAAFERHEADVPYPGGESGADVWNRARRTLDEIAQSGLRSAAVVAHGGTIRSILCGALGLPQERRFFLGNPPEHCGISILEYSGGQYYLHSFNDCAHLGDCI